MDQHDRYAGAFLDDRYEILELIGVGGMAHVYKARCHRLNRMVAIKILKEDLANDEEFKKRFHTESQAIAMLSHPNIVAVYDVSRTGKTEFIVMELIEGITLKQYINRKGLLNWKEALHFATQVTKALSHAHSRGIIHRDIKPHNIMILKDGSVKVADFGIARLIQTQNTLTREAFGSVHYISPEQAKGGYVDARSDIYSVGVVMYEMLTSRLPFVGESAVSIAIQHISAIPLMPRDINPDVPIGLESITMRAMEPDLNMRFTTADEMLIDLEEFRKNPSIIFEYVIAGSYDKLPNDPTEEEQATRAIVPGTVVNTGPLPVRRKTIGPKPEMSPDEHRAARKKASTTSTLIGVFSIIVFLVAVFAFMWFRGGLGDIFGRQQTIEVEVPNFVHRIYDDIVNDDYYLERFTFIRQSQQSELPIGVIISQTPDANSLHEITVGGSVRVTLIVSEGTEIFHNMPPLIGYHISQAINYLDNLQGIGLNIEFEAVISNEDEINIVLSTIPAEGSVLRDGNVVVLRYGSGPDVNMVTVPELTGRTLGAVYASLTSLGLVPAVTEFYDNLYAEGLVFWIYREGQEVEVGTVIEVYVSLGPEATPEPDPPPQPPPDPDPDPEDPDPDIDSDPDHDTDSDSDNDTDSDPESQDEDDAESTD